MDVNCKHWKDCGINGGGCCTLGLYNGKPSYGVCYHACKQRDPKYSEEDMMSQKAKENLLIDNTLKTTLGIADKLKAIVPVLASIVNSEEISVERQQKRLDICAGCEKLSIIDGKIGCGVCGCKLKVGDRSIINLINKEETDLYGCKHPIGSKWKAAGV